MDNQEFYDARSKLDTLCSEILTDRGPAYAGKGGDRFANFKLIADLLNNFNVDSGTQLGTWSVYFLKPVLSILAYIGEGTESEEKIAGRFADARNYLDLGYGMVEEETEATSMLPDYGSDTGFIVPGRIDFPSDFDWCIEPCETVYDTNEDIPSPPSGLEPSSPVPETREECPNQADKTYVAVMDGEPIFLATSEGVHHCPRCCYSCCDNLVVFTERNNATTKQTSQCC